MVDAMNIAIGRCLAVMDECDVYGRFSPKSDEVVLPHLNQPLKNSCLQGVV